MGKCHQFLQMPRPLRCLRLVVTSLWQHLVGAGWAVLRIARANCSAALLTAGRGRAQRPGGAPELWQVQLCHGLGVWVHRGAQAGQGWGQSGEVKAKQRAGCVQSCWLHPPGQAADGISLQEMEVALWMKTLNKTFSLKCFGVSMTKGLLELLFSLGHSAQGVMGTSCSRGCSLHSG